MTVELNAIEAVKGEIVELKARYKAELNELVAKLNALENEAIDREGLLDLDAEEEAMREHLKLMM